MGWGLKELKEGTAAVLYDSFQGFILLWGSARTTTSLDSSALHPPRCINTGSALPLFVGSSHQRWSGAVKPLCLSTARLPARSRADLCWLTVGPIAYWMQSFPFDASRCFACLGTAKLPPAVLLSSSISSLLVLLFLIPLPHSQPLVSVQRLGLICCCPGARIFKSEAMELPLHGEDSCSLAPPSGPGPEHRAQQPLTGPLAFSPRIWLEVWNWADSWYTLPGQPQCLGLHCFCPNHIWFLSKSVSVRKTSPGAFGCAHSWNTSYERKHFGLVLKWVWNSFQTGMWVFPPPQLKHLNLPLCFPERKLTLFKSVLGLIPNLLHPLLLDLQNCFMPRCSLWNLTSIYILCTLTSRVFYIE